MATIDLRSYEKDIYDIVQHGLMLKAIRVDFINQFTGLSDTPDSYSGQQGKTLKVNSTEDALEFVALTGTDEKAAVDADGTPGYLGDSANNGILRTDAPLTYTDGGSFVTLGLDQSALTITESQISDLQTYLTAEVDPIFSASPAAGITGPNITNWNTAYGWGSHAGLYDAIGVAASAVASHESSYNHALLHSPVTVAGAPLTLSGQQITFNYDANDFQTSGNNLQVKDSGIDHGSIGGLTDNDHTQYANGASAPLAMSGQSIVLNKNDNDFKNDLSGSPAISKLGIHRTWDFDIINPNAVYAKDTQVFIAVAKANLTITRVRVELDGAGNQVAGDLKYADAFIGFGGAVVINDFDTTSGTRDDTSITSGAVAAGKCVYLQFDSQPNSAITQMHVHIEWDFDPA